VWPSELWLATDLLTGLAAVLTALAGLVTAYAGLVAVKNRTHKEEEAKCQEELDELRNEYEDLVRAAVHQAHA
jgi:Na+-transporting methylmalonyl-CoA/oxaloacetate decarboxylase gamma subunit